ncbi:MAG: hypothetical protein GXP16_06600 [Gammaproteobacteria bacterium]|nr:hypothetical protein [Gammaproteobacteria bacterium]
MVNLRIIGGVLTFLSIVSAVGVLGVLLLIATSPAPEQFRQIDAQNSYLQQTTAALVRGITVVQRQQQPLDRKIDALDNALHEGAVVLNAAVLDAYQPITVVGKLRRPVMQWFNIIDHDAGELSESEEVTASLSALMEKLSIAGEQLQQFNGYHVEMMSALSRFDSASKEVIGGFRERGDQQLADNIYVNTKQIKNLLLSGVGTELDSILEVVAELEKPKSNLLDVDKSRLRAVINESYTLISLRRGMDQMVLTLDHPGLVQLLNTLNAQTTQDQLYVLATVNDARVLLNIYTILMLVVLGFFGLRLQISHKALNRSHDDLELRVAARTEDLKQANVDLKESQVQLVQAEKMSSLGQLVAGVMHEINTPLLYVLNNTMVTAETVTDINSYMKTTLPILRATSSEEAKQAIKNILTKRGEFDVDELAQGIEEVASLATDSIDGLNQISELVQSLKDFSRLDRVANDSFDVREGIEKTLTMTRNMLKSGIQVEKNLVEVPQIFCSPSRLNQVFINIVTNAVQAMDGEGVLKISTSHVQSSKGEWIEIIFEDSGCGIAEENVDKIMDPFFTTKPVGQGTGLGLSIVRQIVDQHGGQILIDSKVGHGTRITVSLPVRNEPLHTDQEEAA